ncbi:hypothetical protein PENTCL1PPCAC_5768, partial [Pristionchus entomophagus]
MQEKLQKLQFELNFERTCRETEKRIMNELEVQLVDASKKLEGASRKEMNAFCNIRELALENKALQNMVAQECQRNDTVSEQSREKEVFNREVAVLKIKIGHGLA